MSLFSSREWWSTRLGSSEEFDQGCICLANIDNEADGSVKIVTGSLSGMLRVHQPGQRGYQVEDLLLESDLGAPILQLAAGRFMGGEQLMLAVLHPQQLLLVRLSSAGSAGLQLLPVTRHTLTAPAANMAWGGFGNATTIDMICVQSLDCRLSFYEGASHSFDRHLPNGLLPGPLLYVAASSADLFVTVSACLELEAYKYSNLVAAAGEKAEAGAGAALPGGKKLQGTWRLVLGETATELQLSRGTAYREPELLVMGEHTLFTVNLRGQLVGQRRLDYHPACCWPYVPSSDVRTGYSEFGGAAAEHLLVATHNRALLVYTGPALAWAARLEVQPVAVRVAAFGGVEGLIVVLDDAGQLSVLFLGTDPPTSTITYADGRPVDYVALEEERRTLLAKIKQHQASQQQEQQPTEPPPAQAAGWLQMRAHVPGQLDSEGLVASGGPRGFTGGTAGAGATQGPSRRRQLTVKLSLTALGGSSLQEVLVTAAAPAPLELQQQQVIVPEVSCAAGGGLHQEEGAVVEFVLLTSSGEGGPVPASTTLQFTATYRSSEGAPCCACCDVQLPLGMFVALVPPVKATAPCRVTIDTNRDPPPLPDLFYDMVAQAPPAIADMAGRSQAAAAVMSFAYHGHPGCVVTILVSKNGGRYRLQGDTLQALWLPLQALAARLPSYIAAADAKPGAAGGPTLSISYHEELPVQEVLGLVEGHWATRRSLAVLGQQLEGRAQQWRSIQKRLLVRFKDKTPTPLGQLGLLLEETYAQLVALADQAAAAQAALTTSGQALGAGVALLLQLVRHQSQLSTEDMSVLSAALSPAVTDAGDIGWEEVTEAALTHLLRTVLSKSSKEAAAAVAPLAAAPDTQRLKKHLQLVLERVAASGAGSLVGAGGVAAGGV